MDSQDDWIVVTKGPKSQKLNKTSSNHVHSNNVTIKHSLKENKVMYTLSDLEKSEVKKSTLEFLKSKDVKKLAIRSLGVGSITSNVNGYFQTILIIIIQETLKKQYPKNFNSAINDPIFSKEDVEFVKSHEIERIEDDIKIMTIMQYETCIFYMPHCEQELYIKVLTLNSKSLDKICIIGNSLITYLEKAQVTGKTKTEEYEILKAHKNLLIFQAIKKERYRYIMKDMKLSMTLILLHLHNLHLN